MADTKKRGGELSRSATVTVRLDPKLRYLAGLAARKQRRTLSSYIEWAIEESLKRVSLGDFDKADDNTGSISDQAEELWDVDEPDRFIKLAIRYPEILTHDEQILWKLIRENGHLWRGKLDSNGRWRWRVLPDKLIPHRLRQHWELFNEIARGEKSRLAQPSWDGMPPIESFDDDFEI